jgi:hypothetical protein
MVLESRKYDCVADTALIAAFLSTTKSVFIRGSKSDEYEVALAHSKFHGAKSDVMAFLEVWKWYQQNKKDSQYDGKKRSSGQRRNSIDSLLKENFLNGNVLREVEGVYEDMLKILKRSHIEARSSYDRAEGRYNVERVGKSFLAGFADNLLQYDGGNSYTPLLRSTLGRTRAFPGSAARSSQSELFACVGFYKSLKGTLFANVSQPVKPEWIVEVASHLVESSEYGEAYFDEDEGVFTQRVEHSLKKNGTRLLIEKKHIEDERASKSLARHLAKHRDGLDFQSANSSVGKDLDTLWRKSFGAIGTKDMGNVYEKVLREHGVRSMAQLKQLLQRSPEALTVSLQTFCSQDEIDRIERESPESVVIGDMPYHVEYEHGDRDGLERNDRGNFRATVQIPVARILSLDSLPKLPSGESLYVEGVSGFESSYVRFASDDVVNLKNQAGKYERERQWSEWSDAEKSSKEFVVEAFDASLGVVPPLPESISYGVDPISRETLYAYPFFVRSSYGDAVRVEYSQSREEADQRKNIFEKYVRQALEARLMREKERREKVKKIDALEETLQKFFDLSDRDAPFYDLRYRMQHTIDDILIQLKKYHSLLDGGKKDDKDGIVLDLDALLLSLEGVDERVREWEITREKRKENARIRRGVLLDSETRFTETRSHFDAISEKISSYETEDTIDSLDAALRKAEQEVNSLRGLFDAGDFDGFDDKRNRCEDLIASIRENVADLERRHAEKVSGTTLKAAFDRARGVRVESLPSGSDSGTEKKQNHQHESSSSQKREKTKSIDVQTTESELPERVSQQIDSISNEEGRLNFIMEKKHALEVELEKARTVFDEAVNTIGNIDDIDMQFKAKKKFRDALEKDVKSLTQKKEDKQKESGMRSKLRELRAEVEALEEKVKKARLSKHIMFDLEKQKNALERQVEILANMEEALWEKIG